MPGLASPFRYLDIDTRDPGEYLAALDQIRWTKLQRRIRYLWNNEDYYRQRFTEAGVPLQTLPQHVIERTAEQKDAIMGDDSSFFPAGKREWAAHLRRLERELPGFQD
jgi:hypothetical protein